MTMCGSRKAGTSCADVRMPARPKGAGADACPDPGKRGDGCRCELITNCITMKTEISFDHRFLLPSMFFFLHPARKVSFDREYLYFSVSGRSQKLDLNRVIEIKTGIIPVFLYLFTTYVVTIIYEENGRKKNFRFLSRPRFGSGSVRGIQHIDTLRSYVLNKKYSQ
jgi:hypothetical protein